MPGARPIAPGLFTDGADARLIAGRCAACRGLHFPAGAICPYCAADGCLETPVGARGHLRLYTAVLTAPPGYRGDVPYGFGVVEVEDGLCVIARLTESRLDRLRPGLPVRLVVGTLFTDDDGEAVLDYAFRPEEG